MLKLVVQELDDYIPWYAYMKGWILDFSATRLKLIRARETPADAMSSGGAGNGEAAGEMPTAEPSTALPGAGGPSASSGSEKTEQQIEIELARARIFGVPPPAASADVVKKETHRFAQWLEKQQQEYKAKLEQDCAFPLTKEYFESDAEKQKGNQSFTGTSDDTAGPSPNEAWITRSKRKFEIYARRVVQFYLLSISGLEEQLAPLRQANIQTILSKYKSLLSDSGWGQRFLPSAFLELACRSEIRSISYLMGDEKQVFAQLMEKVSTDYPQIDKSTRETVEYAYLRTLPTTIFGFSSSGTVLNGQGKSPGAVLHEHIVYDNLDFHCPHEDTIEALSALVKMWISGKGRSKISRSVHIFWSMQQFWSSDSQPTKTHSSKT